ncbi:uncharacterized protein [Rutidosis leptorrhynchoides]|uniref:uncharacterized protein n=1 Tax=Rutidosis leptorrhynchoides TaxID=125765 RepID=UPI003A994712
MHLIPIKLDLAKLNYTNWSALFANHCSTFNVSAFLQAATISHDDEETQKTDAAVLGWIYLTISEPLLEQLLNSQPKTAFEAWEILKKIFQDNKRSKVVELTAELRALNIGDLNPEQYFRKIDVISAMLANLGATIKDEYRVTYAIHGLNDRFPHAKHIILHSNPFPNYDTVRSIITLEQMELTRKNRPADTAGTPSAPTALVAQAINPPTTPPRPTTNLQVCRNFNRGHCRFGSGCRYLHQPSRAKSGPATSQNAWSSTPSQAQLLEIIAAQQRLLAQQQTNQSIVSQPMVPFQFKPHIPLAQQGSPPSFPALSPQANWAGHVLSPVPQAANAASSYGVSPLGPVYYPAHYMVPSPAAATYQPTPTNGQETVLPQAFNTATLQDFRNAGWHMDTGASAHLSSSLNCLNTIFNYFNFPSVAVGDGNSIPVINTGHSVLPNVHRPLYLSNVLVNPNIVKNLIFVRRFARDNKVSVCFDEFGFCVKDYMTNRQLLRCDSTGDLYPFTNQSLTLQQQALLTTSTT